MVLEAPNPIAFPILPATDAAAVVDGGITSVVLVQEGLTSSEPVVETVPNVEEQTANDGFMGTLRSAAEGLSRLVNGAANETPAINVHPISIVDGRAKFKELLRDPRRRPYVLVKQPDGRDQLLLGFSKERHDAMLRVGERVVAAGYILLRNGELTVNGKSPEFPTRLDVVEAAAGTVHGTVDDEGGLFYVFEFIERLLGGRQHFQYGVLRKRGMILVEGEDDGGDVSVSRQYLFGRGEIDPAIMRREAILRLKNMKEPVLIPKDGPELISVLQTLGGARKYVVVRRRGGCPEIRIGYRVMHDNMVLCGEKVVGAGVIYWEPKDRIVRFDGSSVGYITKSDFVARQCEATHPVDDDAGLSAVARFLKSMVGDSAIIQRSEHNLVHQWTVLDFGI